LLFILIFTFSEKDWGGQISKLFSFKLFVYLGSLSFPIYVFHHTVICWYRTLNFDLSSQYLHSVLLLMFIILLAYLYNSLLEHKIRRFVETKYKYYEKNKCV
jgi:peptidoglycan/LPS O-acetylase OafA/YrhL